MAAIAVRSQCLYDPYTGMKPYEGNNPFTGVLLGTLQALAASLTTIPRALRAQGPSGFAPAIRVALLGFIGRPFSWMLVRDSPFGAESRLRYVPHQTGVVGPRHHADLHVREGCCRRQRVRPPRFFSGPRQPLDVYSRDASVGEELLARASRGEHRAEGYVFYDMLPLPDQRAIVGTRESLLYVSTGPRYSLMEWVVKLQGTHHSSQGSLHLCADCRHVGGRGCAQTL